MATILFWLYKIGVFKDFWFWTVSHNLQVYQTGRPVAGFWRVSQVSVSGDSGALLQKVKMYFIIFTCSLRFSMFFPDLA